MRILTTDNKKYIVIEELKNNDVTSLYLVNEKDQEDIIIQKEINGEILPLEDENDFKKSLAIFAKEHKNIIEILLKQ